VPSPPYWETRGREFKSRRSDQAESPEKSGLFSFSEVRTEENIRDNFGGQSFTGPLVSNGFAHTLFLARRVIRS
jgi:hypothetical protein